MADGESPKARPKRVKPDRPRPTTGSFRPTGSGSPRPIGQRPGGQRASAPRPRPTGGGGPFRPGGGGAGRGYGPDSHIPRGPDDWSSGNGPSGRGRDDRPGADRSGPGGAGGDRPRFDHPRPERGAFGFRGRADRPAPWQGGPPPPSEQRPRPNYDRPAGRVERSGSDRPGGFGDRQRLGNFGARPGRFDDRPRPAGFTPRPTERRFGPAERPFERPRTDRPDRPDFDRPVEPVRDRPAGPERGRPSGPRSFGVRPDRPRPDYPRPDYPRQTSFNRPGLEPAEAGLVESGDEIVAGRRPVEEAFVARREARRLLVVPQRRGALEKIVLHATSLRIPIVEVEGGSLTALTGFDGHQGIALVVAPRRYSSVTEILARAIERGEPPFVLILDSLEDPQNVGTLLRSAEAAGAHGVIFPTRRQAPLSPAAVKASAGAVEHLLLAPVDDLAGALADLHVAGLRVVGAEAEAPLTVRQADLRGPLALVIGSEGQGLGPTVRRRCDLMVRIPMRGAIGSLNASVAGSILLFEATTQRAGLEAIGETPGVAAVLEAHPAAGEVPVGEVEAPGEAVAPAGKVPVAEVAAPEPSTATKRVRSSRSAKDAGPVAKDPLKSAAKAAAKTTAKSEAKAAEAPKPTAKSVAKSVARTPPKSVAKSVAKTPPKSVAKAVAKAAKAPKPVASPPASADIGDDLLP
jgi:23S rRNA (guanosine2251-2'-O)-methyltransferase